MDQPIKILIAAAELTPIAKVGGLGDVISALPKALIKLGVDARVIIPFYKIINRKRYKFRLIKSGITIPTKVKIEQVNLWQTNISGVTVYLIEHDFYNSGDIYSSKLNKSTKLYPSNLIDIEKFIFFSHALLESTKAINFKPDIIHLNDWHTAAVTLFLQSTYKNGSFFRKTKTLLTIHNLANQGITEPEIINLNQINPSLASAMEDLKNKDINFLAQGIINADLINTVSPTYAKEILTSKFSAGLGKVLAKRKTNLYGILNGLDTNFYDPKTDKFIKQNYTLTTLSKKIINKTALQKTLHLPIDQKIALIGLVSRLVWQKGIDLLNENIVKLLNCQIVILGTGEKKIENKLSTLAKKYPKKISTQIKFDEPLAHQIYAASDVFLMPSRFEPCGLGQMIAMRYGTVPIVYATGGLKDTIKNFRFSIFDFQTNSKIKIQNLKANGFSFSDFNSQSFFNTLKSALKIYYDKPEAWRRLQQNCMGKNFSWDKSAAEYLKIYKSLLAQSTLTNS